jgi:hypothetical protein
MWDRLFGRGKQELPAEPTCAACGRTLLPGEWAQTVLREDGVEEVVCSLCAQAHDYDTSPDHNATAADFEQAVGSAPAPPPGEHLAEPIAVTGRPQQSRGRPQHDSDSFWRALKEKDAEIARLQAELARVEDQNRQLNAQLAESWQAAAGVAAAASWEAQPAGEGQWPVQQPVDWTAAMPATEPTPWPAAEAVTWPEQQTDDGTAWPEAAPPTEWEQQWPATQPPERDESSAEVTAEWPAGTPAAAPGQPDAGTALAAATAGGVVDEWTGHSQMPTAPAQAWPPAAPLETVATPATAEDAPPAGHGDEVKPTEIVDMPTEPLEVHDGAAPLDDYCPACDTDELPVALGGTVDDDDATVQIPAAAAAQRIVFEPQEEPADLHLLERGADLFNVSPMPHKIAESNDLLGLPAVHLSSEGDVVTALFLWSMAWYEYRIDLTTGEVVLASRGYEDRHIERPNSTSKPDGTVQLAPLPARRAVVQPAAAPEQESGMVPAAVDAPIADEPQPIVPGKGDIISKSLKGQRTDDAGVAWDEMAARDFDWGR